MNILVCISQAPDTTSRIAFKDGDTRFDESGVTFIVNPYDEWYALVRGLELKEAHGGTVTCLMVGTAAVEPSIRKALAIGADEAVRVDLEPTDALQTATAIADHARGKGYDLVLCGKETIDHNGGAVPGMVAELLDLPYVPLATKLDREGSGWVVERDAAGGTEVVGVDGPVVVGAAKGMAEQRIPNMRGIMAARTKSLAVEASSASASTSVAQFALPPAKGAVKLVPADRPEELIRLLREEAKVI
jgi:electron transfer flavoprotein beta subunit